MNKKVAFADTTAIVQPQFHQSNGSFAAKFSQGTGGVVIDHNDLMGRDADNQHPISAIIGLADELKDINSNYVKTTDFAGDAEGKGGVVRISDLNYGVEILKKGEQKGTLRIKNSEKSKIDERTSYAHEALTLDNIDYAVKKALADDKLSGTDYAWTDEEKAAARILLGIYPRVETWKDVAETIRMGLGAELFPVGYEFTTYDSEQSRDITWVVRGHDHHAAANSSLTHTMTLETKCVYSDANGTFKFLSFDNGEALYYAADGLAAGTYRFTVANQVWYPDDNGKTYQFTLANPVPVGGQIVLSMTYNAALEGKSVITYSSAASTAVIETATLTEGSEGASLGTTDGNGDYINHMHRAIFGSNNYAQSAARQWLNSSAAAGAVWTPTNIFDRPPSWNASYSGFMRGLPADFLAVVEPAKIPCRTNGTFEVGSLSGAEYAINQVYELQDKFFLLSRPEIYGSWDDAALKDGTLLEFYDDVTNTDREKYETGGLPRYWWTRSPNKWYADGVRAVDTLGALNNGNAKSGVGVAPACIIA